MKRKRYRLAAGAAVLYLLLLFLLVAAERTAPEASIRSFGAAVWYSLTTLTTVGYGDLYPVTAAGRIIGAVFQFMSVGLLVVLIGAFAALLRGTLLPLAKLRLNRRREWYVFSALTPESRALAEALIREDRNRIILFCGDEEPPLGIRSPLEIEAICGRKKEGLSVFCMSESMAENEQLARTLEKWNCSVYCMSSYEPDRVPARQHRFNAADCCARLYWKKYPLRSDRETIVLVGQGAFAASLLEQALAVNIRSCSQEIRYEAYGDFGSFRRNHPCLPEICEVNAARPGRDSLYFRDMPWNEEPGVLEDADRIIFCSDSEEENLQQLTLLRRYFPVTGNIYAKISVPFDGVTGFGSCEEIFTPELVMQTRLNRLAMRLNEIYRKGVPGAPDWDELSSFTRRSNLASADHLEMKLRILLGTDQTELTADACRRAVRAFRGADPRMREEFRQIEHARWMRFLLLNGWQYAPVRDNVRRHHPLLLPYEQLSAEDQAKDDAAWELFGTLAGEA